MRIAIPLALLLVFALLIALPYWITTDEQRPLITAITEAERQYPELAPELVARHEKALLAAHRFQESAVYTAVLIEVALAIALFSFRKSLAQLVNTPAQ